MLWVRGLLVWVGLAGLAELGLFLLLALPLVLLRSRAVDLRAVDLITFAVGGVLGALFPPPPLACFATISPLRSTVLYVMHFTRKIPF